MLRVSRLIAFGCLMLSLSLAWNPPCAHALDKNIQRVLILGGYGLAAGTLVGAITIPLTQDVRSMFIGSSVGMYLGAVVGIFYVFTRTDKDNPILYDQKLLPSPYAAFKPGDMLIDVALLRF